MTDEDRISALEKECRRLWLAVFFISLFLAMTVVLLTIFDAKIRHLQRESVVKPSSAMIPQNSP